MEKNEYNALPMSEQAIILWDKGMFVELWQEPGAYKVGMYMLFGQMVSVYYDKDFTTINSIKMWGFAVHKTEVLGQAVMSS